MRCWLNPNTTCNDSCAAYAKLETTGGATPIPGIPLWSVEHDGHWAGMTTYCMIVSSLFNIGEVMRGLLKKVQSSDKTGEEK